MLWKVLPSWVLFLVTFVTTIHSEVTVVWCFVSDDHMVMTSLILVFAKMTSHELSTMWVSDKFFTCCTVFKEVAAPQLIPLYTLSFFAQLRWEPYGYGFREQSLRNIISERVLKSLWCLVMCRRLLLNGGVSGQWSMIYQSLETETTAS